MKQTCWIQRSILMAALLATAACAPRKSVKPSAQGAGENAAAGAAQTTPPAEVAEANLRGADFSAAPELEVVHFDYDSYALSGEARDVLKRNAEHLKSKGSTDVLAAGNCDERGTIAYNLALGQKRAQAVRDYYIRLGLPGSSIATISYGKEKPTCSESNETCWTKNRRTETLIRQKQEKKS